MNARILALGAVMVLAASAVDAQAPGKGRGGFGKGRPTADSSARKADDKDHDKHHKADKRDDDDRRGMGAFGRNGGYLFSGIELTDIQKNRIKTIRESYRPRLEALRDSTKTARKDKVETAADTAFRAKTRALVTSERAEIRAVLTAEQQVRYDANAKRMAERMDRQRGRGRGGERSNGSRS